MQCLTGTIADSEMAFGSDAMSLALKDYDLLKLSGKSKDLALVQGDVDAHCAICAQRE